MIAFRTTRDSFRLVNDPCCFFTSLIVTLWSEWWIPQSH